MPDNQIDNNINNIDQNHMFEEIQPGPTQANNIPVVEQPDVQGAVSSNPMTDPNSEYQQYSEDYYEATDFYVGEPEVQVTQNKDSKSFTQSDWFQKLSDFLIKKWYLILGGVILVASLFVAASFIFSTPLSPYGPSDFLELSARIEGPTTSPSASPGQWKVVIENKNQVTIEDVRVDLDFDPAFKYLKAVTPDPSVPTGEQYTFSSLPANSSTIIQFEGSLVGVIDEEPQMIGTVSYTPLPLRGQPNSQRVVSIQGLITKITRPVISVSIVPFEQVIANGSEAQLTISFENQSEREIQDLRIRVQYPDRGTFELTESQLQLSNLSDIQTQPNDGNNIWFISSIPRLQKQTLLIKGRLSGAEGVRQPFTVEIGARGENNQFTTIASTSTDITIKADPLVLTTYIDGRSDLGTFKSGERLKFVVDYQNKGSSTLNDVAISMFIDDPANILDYSTIAFIGGDRGNETNEVIKWEGNGTPQLSRLNPQQKGSISFQIQVKEDARFIQTALNQNRYTLQPRVQAQASNLDLFEIAGSVYKAQGDMNFVQEIADSVVSETNTNEALVKVTWTITSKQNELINTRVTAVSSLPDDAFLVDATTPIGEKANITYDDATGRLTWSPGRVLSYAGASNPAVTVTLTFKIQSTSGAFAGIQLFDQPQITALDDFTGARYEKTDGSARVRR